MKILAVILLIITAIILGLLAYKNTTNRTPELTLPEISKQEDKKDKKSKKKDDKEENRSSASLEILERFTLPEILTEVSDISNVDDKLFACIQDEEGVIYMYNISSNKIERQIPFAGKGDYEGLALAGNTGYVVNSSGVIYEVVDINNKKSPVKQYKTDLTEKDDVEAICYDKANNRLLLAFKGEEENGNSKGIYSFDLGNKQLGKSTVYSISFDAAEFETDGKKKKQGIKPSAIAIHPISGDIYITEGTNPKLLVLDKQGKSKSIIQLDKEDFAQPEGITFNSSGEMFISNEGKNGDGNILKVRL